MKKIHDFPSYLKLQKRRARKSRRDFHIGRAARRRFNIKKVRRELLRKGFGIRVLSAPAIFSLVNNPEEMLRFIAVLKDHLFRIKRNVIVDLSDVSEVTNDGIILLLSIAQDRQVPGWVKVYVEVPTNEIAAKRFRESGIDEHCEVQDLAVSRKGHIRVKNSYDADTEMANELIQFATRELFGRRQKLQKVQRVLSEAIANTEEHASGDRARRKAKMWWGTVYCDKEEGVAHFSLLDNGIGIINHLKMDWFSRLPMLATYRDNISLMRAVIEGRVLSSTKEQNRGNGLPAIYKARDKKEFQRLVLITNNTFIDFDRDRYVILSNSFAGTFFYWEVRVNAGPKSK